MGLVKVKSGKIEMNGESIASLPPYVIAGKGVSLVPEDQGIFAYLTVAENIRVAIQPSTPRQEAKKRQDFILQLFPDLQRAWNSRSSVRFRKSDY
jgi:branched-chain amino acid transport system ATP-binding protein